MERYDKLAEEIELVKEQCNTKLEDQKEQAESVLREFESRASRMEQQLRHQVGGRAWAPMSSPSCTSCAEA